MKTILITGSSGFIGFHLCQKLLTQGYEVIGVDNENDYYDVSLKKERRQKLLSNKNYHFYSGNIADLNFLTEVFTKHHINKVFNLAAQAGVRYSFENPYAFIDTNIVGYHNLISLAQQNNCSNFVYASTGSVYGENGGKDGETTDACDKPLSLYAATKKTNELIAHSYSHTYGMQTIGLRFFNVVGPRGRPDAAYYIFTKNILAGEPIRIHNHGKMKRNNTYVGDIVDGIIRSLDYNNGGKYEIFNLGNEREVELMYFIERIEQRIGKIAVKNFIEIQPGEIPSNSVDSSLTQKKLGREATTQIEEMLDEAVDRQRSFYNI